MEKGGKAVLQSDLAKFAKVTSKKKRKKDYVPAVEASDVVVEIVPLVFVFVSAPITTDVVPIASAKEVTHGVNGVEALNSTPTNQVAS